MFKDLRNFDFRSGCQSFLVNTKEKGKPFNNLIKSWRFLEGLPAVKKLAKEVGVSEDLGRL